MDGEDMMRCGCVWTVHIQLLQSTLGIRGVDIQPEEERRKGRSNVCKLEVSAFSSVQG